MGGLAHYFEKAGLATTQISLIRLHTEKIKPPRALWVPFELGRPLGVPGNPEFQTRVLLAALKLLEAPAGPILEDFPEEAPAGPDTQTGWACPISLPAPPESESENDRLVKAFLDEINRLATWYDLAVRKRGRTTVGVSGLEPPEIGRFLAGFLDGGIPDNPRPDLPWPWLVKLAEEDLKAYYLEAVTAQPGPSQPDSRRLTDWFWGETLAGQILLQLQSMFAEHADKEARLLGRLLLVPMSQAHRLKPKKKQN